MKKFLAVAAALVVAAAAAAPAQAITRGGTLDGDAHPYVGVMVAKVDDAAGVPQPAWRCSGALVSPTVYVTAGHCTFGADEVEVWFESDLQSLPQRAGYPFEGPTSVTGTPTDHPEYSDDAFYRYDLGVVVLDDPVDLDRYAALPEAGYVDALGTGRKGAVVTAVGYGLQASSANPLEKHADKTVAQITRYQADLFIVNTQGAAGIGTLPDANSMVLSGDAKHGGTCFGDSGGPSLVGDTLVAVTSFGLNSNCGGIGGVFRIDRAEELAFIGSFLD